MAHQPQGGGIGVAVRDQPIGEGAQPPEQIGQDGEAELHRHETGQSGEGRVRHPAGDPGSGGMGPGMFGDDGVEDELAEIEHQHRQARPRETQSDARHQQARARRVDEAKQRRQVAQGAHALDDEPVQQGGEGGGGHRGGP